MRASRSPPAVSSRIQQRRECGFVALGFLARVDELLVRPVEIVETRLQNSALLERLRVEFPPGRRQRIREPGDVRLYAYRATRGFDVRPHPSSAHWPASVAVALSATARASLACVFAGAIGSEPASPREDELGEQQEPGEQREARAYQQQRPVAHEPGDERDERDGERGQRRKRPLLWALPGDRGARLFVARPRLLLIGELAERL